MKSQWDDFPELGNILEELYSDLLNVYTHFAYDFPAKWFKLRKNLESKNQVWKLRLDKVILGIYLPLYNESECVLLTYIDINQIVPIEICEGNYQSLEKSFMNEVPDGKILINIIQLYNHFEPIQINEQVGKLVDSEQIANKHFLS